ncbi:hypothetical protein [Thiocapsa rosea]|uniref:Uncharacterized protein n=1 Tax=Thiocapsa rosea TaxID=69360 RepID=A0A495V3G5_9GAMM|nr:hypothetical protein [Thiocapsa rosea]RKT43123.1 hypothetical protein BDD21_0434 [Thiocapsa rosea]
MHIFGLMLATGVLSLSAIPGANAASVSLMGDWLPTIGAPELVGGAGTDFRFTIESSAYQATLSVAYTGGAPWRLVVNRSGFSLPAGVTLAVRRNGSGSCGNLIGGLDYLTVSDQGQELFSGTGDCSGIGIQLRLEGVSIRQPPGFYETTVLYTVQ